MPLLSHKLRNYFKIFYTLSSARVFGFLSH
jgi:hypothetical protein